MRVNYAGQPHFPNRNDLEEPLLKVLIREFGGSINFSTHGQQLEIILAKEVGVSDADRGFASLNYHSAGHRKWRNEIQFVRDRLVKTGQLSNAVRGRWTVTEAGYQRVGMAKPAGVR